MMAATRFSALMLAATALLMIAVPASALAQGDTVRVRGHWALEVRGADGGLVSRTEFDNALHPYGPEVIASVLTGRVPRVSFWSIEFNREIGGEHVNASINPWRNLGHRPTIDPARVSGLTEIILSGSIVATDAGQVQHVHTFVDSMYFTEAKLPTPVQLEAGQTLDVTVTISFASMPHPPGQ